MQPDSQVQPYSTRWQHKNDQTILISDLKQNINEVCRNIYKLTCLLVWSITRHPNRPPLTCRHISYL